MMNGSRSPHENGDASKLNLATRHKQSHNDDSSRSPHSDNGSSIVVHLHRRYVKLIVKFSFY